jgi:hypothetical protein
MGTPLSGAPLRTTATWAIALTPAAALILAVAILMVKPAWADMDYDARCAGAISSRRDQIYAPFENPPYRKLTSDERNILRSITILNDTHFYGRHLCPDNEDCTIQPEFKRKFMHYKSLYYRMTPDELDGLIAACKKSIE